MNVQPQPTSRPTPLPLRRGFTLTELLVVIGIVLLFMLLAIPSFRALSGERSVDSARNQLSAMLVRAREEAIGLQDYRGILFYLDPATDRVVGSLVRSVPVDAATNKLNPTAAIWLDLVTDRDSLMLPVGIRLQTIAGNVVFNGTNGTTRTSDGYIGFNTIPGIGNNVKIGGLILFDGNGRLVSRSFGLACLDTQQTPQQTGMGLFLASRTNLYVQPPSSTVSSPMTSAFGLVLFDNAAFTAQGFTDADPSFPGSGAGGYSSGSPSEQDEENWIDANATPVFINRYTGMMFRGE